MKIKTGRFGLLSISDEDRIKIPQGVLGFPEYSNYCLVDPGDETLILWLQSLENPDVVFPVLEPKIFKPDYAVTLSAVDLRELQMSNLKRATVFSILTIPDDITQMTANLKAPLVVNLENQVAKQIVLQDNELGLRQPMFKELRVHLMTMDSQKRAAEGAMNEGVQTRENVGPIHVNHLVPSANVRSLGV